MTDRIVCVCNKYPHWNGSNIICKCTALYINPPNNWLNFMKEWKILFIRDWWREKKRSSSSHLTTAESQFGSQSGPQCQSQSHQLIHSMPFRSFILFLTMSLEHTNNHSKRLRRRWKYFRATESYNYLHKIHLYQQQKMVYIKYDDKSMLYDINDYYAIHCVDLTMERKKLENC